MRRNHTNMTNPPRRNSGFTLIELIVVILVIAILVAMVMPALNGARISARNAQVVADIKNLEQSIGAFKLKFGREPPSSIILYETAAGWNSVKAATGTTELERRAKNSMAAIREIWPDFDFAYSNASGINPANGTDFPQYGELDINGNGVIDSDPLYLNGPECLAFFLGGVCATIVKSDSSAIVQPNGVKVKEETPDGWAPLGFSTNPRMPFKRGGNRVGPFTDFATERLVSGSAFSSTGSSMPSYLDPLPGQSAPYLYLSSYNGRGYPRVGNDIDLGNEDAKPITFITYYRPGTKLPHNQKTFQIISPGIDSEYGVGGPYEPGKQLTAAQVHDRDNITNFSSGPLQP